MGKKEKLSIQKDKRMEPIDNELDEALGLLENANRQITDLLASFVPEDSGTAPDGPAPAELPDEVAGETAVSDDNSVAAEGPLTGEAQ